LEQLSITSSRHCEERSDEAIKRGAPDVPLDCFGSRSQ
jgi:hypothetical protein